VTAPPASTYRLQLHAGFPFAAAVEVADYLATLGSTAAYTSPVLQAAPGSTSGYDVVDHSQVSDDLGGEAGRKEFVERLGELGLGWVLDIVPNHMSVAVPEVNRWWWDVLFRGATSAYAGHFDIDWSRGRLLLPVLGDPSDESDRLAVVDGMLGYDDHRFPIARGTGDGSPREVHDRQHYELVSWRRGDAELNYRRFFDVSGLAGLRVEERRVFDDTHREVLRWLAAGELVGLRVDHPDGLADPAGYLDTLADAAPGAWVLVEKILQAGEHLPVAWRCAGTTGYDALREISAVLVDPAGAEPLTRLYAELTGDPTDFAEVANAGKLLVATTILAAETRRLARLLPDVANVTDAVAEVLAGFDVYRSYLPDSGAEHVAAAVAEARRRRPDLAAAITAVDAAARATGSEFAVRLQQTTGMVMAKGVEDTAFYRYSRLIALNEVGGDPATFGAPVAEFHAACAERARNQPYAMTTLSTHDTKRSEDVRARLLVLAEMAHDWGQAARRFSARQSGPDPAITYLTWQTLVGAWPLSRERAAAYLNKAAREARQHTSWTDPHPAYDAALAEFVAAVYTDDALRSDIAGFAARLGPDGWTNSLSQKAVQLTMPGVPDVYQGSELWDFSLVDPDNRRPVDYDRRRDLLSRLDAGEVPAVDESGSAKLHLVAQVLRLRRERLDTFAGAYTPLYAVGPAADHVLAFGRGTDVVSVATRLPLGLRAAGGWAGTTLALPAGTWTDRLTGAEASGHAPLDRVLERFPVALLVRTDGPGD